MTKLQNTVFCDFVMGHNFESLPLMTRLNCSIVSSVAIEAIHTYVPASPKVVAKIERVELLLSEELEGK